MAAGLLGDRQETVIGRLGHLVEVEYRGAVAAGVNAVGGVAGADDGVIGVIVIERRFCVERHRLLYYEALGGNAGNDCADRAIHGIRVRIARPPRIVIVPPVAVIGTMMIPLIVVPVIVVPVGMPVMVRVPLSGSGLRAGLRMPGIGLGTGLRVPGTRLRSGLRMPGIGLRSGLGVPGTRLRSGLGVPRAGLRSGLRIPGTGLRSGAVVMSRAAAMIPAVIAVILMAEAAILVRRDRIRELPAARPAVSGELQVFNQCAEVTGIVEGNHLGRGKARVRY